MPKQRTDRFAPEYNDPSPDVWRPNLTNLARLSLTNWIPSGTTAFTEKDTINRLGDLHGRTSLPFDTASTTIAPPQATLDPYRDIKSHSDPSVPARVFAKRTHSEVSNGSDSVFADLVDEEGPWEPDDPRLTGVGKNQLDNESWEEAFQKENHRPPEGDEVESRLAQALATNRHCILLLGKAMLRFGAPVHRLQGMIKAAQKALGIDHASFIFLPATMLASFGDSEFGCADLRLVKQTTSLDLGRVTQTYGIYKDLTRKVIGAGEAAHRLEKLLDPGTPACWTQRTRCLFAFIQGFLVSIVAFNGCIIDAVVAGLFGLFVFTLGTYPASHSTVFSIVYEIVAVISVSFIAQALSAIRGGWICYTATSTAGVVALLPGSMIMSAVQELSAKHTMSGSIKVVWATVWALFLGFSLDFGSQLFLVMDPKEGKLKTIAIAALNMKNLITATFSLDEPNPGVPWTTGQFSFTGLGVPLDPRENHFLTQSCYREDSFPWYRQSAPWWWLLILVPTYATASSFKNLQPWHPSPTWAIWRFRSIFKRNQLLVVMVLISCASFAANRLSARFFTRSDSVTAVGALVVGLLGNLYSRVCKGQAYPAMVTGVLFLIPSGISSVGGESYTGNDITPRILQVSIGVTVGLGLSNWVVYLSTTLPEKWGGKNNKEAVFAF